MSVNKAREVLAPTWKESLRLINKSEKFEWWPLHPIRDYYLRKAIRLLEAAR